MEGVGVVIVRLSLISELSIFLGGTKKQVTVFVSQEKEPQIVQGTSFSVKMKPRKRDLLKIGTYCWFDKKEARNGVT